jgi:hypothetical protein
MTAAVASLGSLEEIAEPLDRPERIEPRILAGEDAIHDEAAFERQAKQGKRTKH